MSNVAVVHVGARTAVGLDARQRLPPPRRSPAMAEAPLANAEGEAITMAFVPRPRQLVGPERLRAGVAPFEEAVDPICDLVAEVHLTIDEGCEDRAAGHPPWRRW